MCVCVCVLLRSVSVHLSQVFYYFNTLLLRLCRAAPLRKASAFACWRKYQFVNLCSIVMRMFRFPIDTHHVTTLWIDIHTQTSNNNNNHENSRNTPKPNESTGCGCVFVPIIVDQFRAAFERKSIAKSESIIHERDPI